MESIVIHPENADQLKNTSTVSIDKSISLPLHVMESIDRSIKQNDAGQTISLEEFTRKYL